MWKVLDSASFSDASSVAPLLMCTLCCCPAGSSLMKVAVKKDGHRFCTHISQVVGEPGSPKDPTGAAAHVRGVLAEF